MKIGEELLFRRTTRIVLAPMKKITHAEEVCNDIIMNTVNIPQSYKTRLNTMSDSNTISYNLYFSGSTIMNRRHHSGRTIRKTPSSAVININGY